ncbi:ATP-dependent DNA helicase UvrD/PcrA [Leucobacter sp. 7(1)]|uniref:UvrD-helicase domain-containing protein n=1 Tax=Leucobacter sp. 7(1) TaxID=1255613 RepID=UPI00097F508F|nr:ATP-dependent helicase [Leucobacter sp. 7(1)]SJN12304.1 ATP-dependent DNA helicase UvrD/PcrA [Leucobacter sp. 7(1)]
MGANALDEAQLAALADGIQLVEAGPGAGKTRTIVERMRRHRNELHKGVALVSFTNTAADEARRRCTSAQLAAPNFVGTLDSFLHKFVVTPGASLQNGTAPKYITSWNDLPDSAVMTRLSGVRGGAGVRLGSFKLRLDGEVEISSSLSREDAMYLGACEKAGKRQELVELGRQRIKGFLANGTFDSDGARIKALEVLSDRSSAVAARLASRFSEIIIDEFQDCSDVEVAIVKRLKMLGVNVVVVADPDQAIYEFRDASPESYREYRESLGEAEIVRLERNYRSSPAICELVAMLRTVGTGTVISDRPEIQHKIVVLAGSSEFQRAQFAGRLADCEIPADKALVLAHEKKQARDVAGVARENAAFAKSDHKTFGLLGSMVGIRDADGSLSRKAAIDRAQRIVLNLFNWNHGEKGLPPKAQIELLGISRSHISACLLGIQSDSEGWTGRSDATVSIRNRVEECFGKLPRTLPRLSSALRSLEAQHWDVWSASLETGAPKEASLPCSHIHAVKGNEYQAVLLSIKKPRGKRPLWDLVRSGQTDESLRVLYVGASRAADLLAIGCTAAEASKMTGLLSEKGIDFDLLKEGKKST